MDSLVLQNLIENYFMWVQKIFEEYFISGTFLETTVSEICFSNVGLLCFNLDFSI